MKGAIASVELFGILDDAPARRLTLTISAPMRGPKGDGWECRLALADLHRPSTVRGSDSVEALARAIDQAREWLAELHAQGFRLYRDRGGEAAFEMF
jgi:hypothetical protein